jgi:Melibiase/Glycosyl hydrolase family 36 C-terminal domain
MRYFSNSRHTLGIQRERVYKCTASLGLWLALMVGLVIPDCQALTAVSLSEKVSSWTLSTDDTLLTLSVEDGRPALRTLRSKVGNDNWLHGSPKEELMETVEVNGSAVKTDWKFQGADLDNKKEQLTLRFANADPQLQLNSIWRARHGPGPIEHWLTIVNDSGHTMTVTHQDSLVLEGLSLAVNESGNVWWINRGGSDASRQGGVFTAKADAELDQVLTSDPVDASSPVPWLALQVGTLKGLYVGWEFSGIGRIHAKTLSTSPTRLMVRVGNAPEFKTDLSAGETLVIPPAFVGCYHGDIDEGSDSLHRFILDKLLPPLPKGKPYPTLAFNLYLDNTPIDDSFTDRGKKVTEADLMRDATLAHDLGFETFMIDAIWFPQSGDWRWDPIRFPKGDRPVREFLSRHGMNLGLWMAYTHGSDSDDPGAMNIFRHPDWFTKTYARGEWKSTYLNFRQSHLDLGFDPARAWVMKETQRAVREYQLDYFKHDYTPIVTQCEQTNHRHKYAVDVSYWSTLGYYEVQEALNHRFPDLTLEGCSGAGHIKDFGYIKRVHYITTTDTLSSLPNRQSIWDSTYAFPPAVLMAYTWENQYNHDSDRPRPYFWRTAMMSAWQLIPGNTVSWTNEEKAAARREVEIYKNWIRPILQDAKVHHVLPRPDDLHWDGMFYWSPSLKRGTLYIFRPNNDEAFQRVRLKGLMTGQQYRVWSEDRSISEQVQTGADLMNTGLKIKLPGKYSSDLIYVEERKPR